MLARAAEVWVVTRENNREAIEKSLSSLPERDHLHFVYVGLPRPLHFWDWGRAVRAYYVVWQFTALKEVKRLARTINFDVAWHVTYANAWIGSALPLAGLPFVYGPVGGGVRAPLRLVPSLGLRGAAYEAVRVVAQAGGRYLNPLARVAWRKADLILAQNPETRDWLPRRHRARVRVFPHVVLEASAVRSGPRPRRTAVLAARLLPWKGGALALRAIAELGDWDLVVCGAGPDDRRLRRICRRSKLEDRVRFVGSVSRDEVNRVLAQEATILLHPSLHEDAGFVVAEAAALGLPVVCLDRGGPPLIAGESAVTVASQGDVVAALARALEEGAGRDISIHDEWLLDKRASELTALFGSSFGAQALKARAS
jgi:glycosyltransferase involved in cell wall biosynthesis